MNIYDVVFYIVFILFICYMFHFHNKTHHNLHKNVNSELPVFILRWKKNKKQIEEKEKQIIDESKQKDVVLPTAKERLGIMYKFLVVLFSTLIISLSFFFETNIPLDTGKTIESVELAMRLFPTFLISICIVSIVAILKYILTDVNLLKIDKPATQLEVEYADTLYTCISPHIISLTSINVFIYMTCLYLLKQQILFLLQSNVLPYVFLGSYAVYMVYGLYLYASNNKNKTTLFISRMLLSLTITTFIMLYQGSILK